VPRCAPESEAHDGPEAEVSPGHSRPGPLTPRFEFARAWAGASAPGQSESQSPSSSRNADAHAGGPDHGPDVQSPPSNLKVECPGARPSPNHTTGRKPKSVPATRGRDGSRFGANPHGPGAGATAPGQSESQSPSSSRNADAHAGGPDHGPDVQSPPRNLKVKCPDARPSPNRTTARKPKSVPATRGRDRSRLVSNSHGPGAGATAPGQSESQSPQSMICRAELRGRAKSRLQK